jgi:uncharacterized glyoxalase superfamily protein PhnB
MAGNVKPVREGLHTLVPHLVIHGAAQAIDFYKKVFNAREISRSPGPAGKLMHAEMKIGDSTMFLADDFPEFGSSAPSPSGSSPVVLNVCVPNCDEIYNAAMAAGAKSQMPPDNMFWGDRYCKFQDPFGHNWAVATHIEDVPPQDLQKRAAEAMAKFAKK